MKGRYLLVALAALSCNDPAAPAPQAFLGGLPLDRPLPPPPPVGLLTCAPLPYATVTQIIGPDGGTIVVGPHTLTVPAGALDTAVSITAVAPSDSVNRVQFQPEGLQFAQPASLTMSYANCRLLDYLVPKRIAYTTDGFTILEYLLSLDDPGSQLVTGELRHFSDYAIAW